LHDERKCSAVRWYVLGRFPPQVSSSCGASVSRETAFTFENMAWIYLLSVLATKERKVRIRKEGKYIWKYFKDEEMLRQ